MFFVTFLLFLPPVAGTPPLRESFSDKSNGVGSLPYLSTSLPVSSLMPTATGSQTLSSFSPPPTIQSARSLASIPSVTPQPVRHQTITHVISPAITSLLSFSKSIVWAAPFETHSSLGTTLHTQDSTTQESHVIPSSSVPSDTTFTVPSQPSPSFTATSATSTIAPKIRFALIGVLAGVPALTVLGFLITIRWRKTSIAQKIGMKKNPPDCTDLGFNNKERKGTRFSSFFGIGNPGVGQSKNLDGRKPFGAVYASSIHSTSGLAGVGAHRGASSNSAPPMIHYMNVAETGLDGELEKKANFDNPFGTPPPVCTGSITAPSRVSPHLPHTPPRLIDLPPLPTATHRDGYTGQFGSAWLAISGPMAILSQKSASRYPSHIQNEGRNGKNLEKFRDPALEHVCGQQPHSSPGLLSPDITNHIRTRIRNLQQHIPLNSHHELTPDVRVSVVPSVYGGLASPGGYSHKKRSPDPSPVLPYPTSSPKPDVTPVLPYLSSPISSSGHPEDRRQAIGPVIVIKVSSPTIDSDSEYADTNGGDGAGGLYVNEVSACARRTGLVGSPHGFVAPSSTFSSVSSYSISGSGGSATSLSTSTILPHESSGSLTLAHSSSSSGASSATVESKMVGPVRSIRVRGVGPEGGREVNRSAVSGSRRPMDIDRLGHGELRGIAF